MELDKRIWNSPQDIQQKIFEYAYNINDELIQVHTKLNELNYIIKNMIDIHKFEYNIEKLKELDIKKLKLRHVDELFTFIKQLINLVKKYSLSGEYLNTIFSYDIIYYIRDIQQDSWATYIDKTFMDDYLNNRKNIESLLNKKVNIIEYFDFNKCYSCSKILQIKKYGRFIIYKDFKQCSDDRIYLCENCLNKKTNKIRYILN